MVQPARDLVVGLDGPAVLVKARVAHRIAPRLAAWVRDVARENGTPDPEVVEAVRALQLAANAYASSRMTAADGSPGLPQAPISRRSAHAWLTVAQVAERLGCRPRNVRDLRERGRLHGEKVDGRWRFDPVEVAELLEERAA